MGAGRHWAEAELGDRVAVYLGASPHPEAWVPAPADGAWPPDATALVADLDAAPAPEALARLLEACPRGAVIALRAGLRGPRPRDLVRIARGRTRAVALRDDAGATILVAERGEPAGWPVVANDGRLVTLTEARLAALEADCTAELLRVRRAGRHAMRSVLETSKAQRAEIARLDDRLVRAHRSTKMRIGNAVQLAAKHPKDTLRLPKRLANLYRQRSTTRALPPPPDPKASLRAELDRQLDLYLERIRRLAPERFVFLFSGTTFIQPLRANRPIRQARLLLERGIPLYFGFHGAMTAPEQPSFRHELLFETPIDFTQGILPKLARADLGGARKTFIVSYPHLAAARHLDVFNANGWATLYDCRDDWEAFAERGAAPWYRGALERYVVNACDASFCVSGPLRDKIAAMSLDRPVEVSPNGYDPAFLSPDYRRAPADTPTIGYFGHLSERWFDWPSLRRMALARPDYRFEIIGHLGPESPDVPDNVRLLGPMTHPEICARAASWQVAIIPFRMGPLADAVDPIKIYEYFALGLPVVSFRMPQIDAYPATRTVETVEDFVAALDAALASPPDPDALRAFIAANTWGHRVDQLLGAADRALDAAPVDKSFHLPPEAAR